ncbi:hypothetical protein Aduo_004690 [Ancylostoma duodenale]
MYTLIFSVGLPNSTKQQEELRNESRVYGDILQANYVDTYRNLTLKACKFSGSGKRGVERVVVAERLASFADGTGQSLPSFAERARCEPVAAIHYD